MLSLLLVLHTSSQGASNLLFVFILVRLFVLVLFALIPYSTDIYGAPAVCQALCQTLEIKQ